MDLQHLETFALADDRRPALAQLIPGTEDFYFYTCLDHLHGRRIAEARELLKTWIQRHGRTTRVHEIERRAALLTATADPKASFQILRDALGVRFDHQRELEGQATNFPEKLDQSLISRKTLAAIAQSHYSNLQGFSDHALDWLVGEQLDDDRRRHLLERLRHPDYPQLVKLILEDLNEKRSGGFGSRPIHTLLLLPQLDELARARPSLRDDTNFVNTYLARLQPSPDVDWENDPAAREAYLEKLVGYVERLAPAFNALKAHVFYHRLEFDRNRGIFDRRRFIAYLQLPRHVSYAKQEYIEHKDRRHHVVSLGTDFRAWTLLGPVHDDTALVTDYLAHFFLEANNYDEFKEWVRDDFLKRTFATTKILAGLGDPERWYSLLDDPAGYQALKDRVDIELLPTNKTCFAANDPVALSVDVKNVPSLVVKVFEINTLNYFLAYGREVDTSVDLDGLVAGSETTYEYSEPALRKVRRTFSFEALNKPGTYVIEFIGNGRSSRALIRKGALRYVERRSAAGHVFTILDEQDNPLPEATLWLGGREYTSKDGEIVIPYSTHPRSTNILLRFGSLTTLDSFNHLGEAYSFEAGIYVDRESLLSRKKAEVIIRPVLKVNGTAVSPKLLEELGLSIVSVDRNGVAVMQEITGWSFSADAETIHSFQVPEDLAHISFSVRGKVRSLSEQRETIVNASVRFTLNVIDATNHIEALFLARTDEGYVLQLLGKTGEPRAHKPINLTLQHRDFTRAIELTLQTDVEGRIELGALAEINSLSARSATGADDQWQLSKDRARWPDHVHAKTGDVITLPWAGGVDRRELSLLERRGGGYLRDCYEALSSSGGALLIRGLTPGDYELRVKDSSTQVEIRVTEGVARGEWIVSKKRLLQTKAPKPLLVKHIVTGETEVEVHLTNAGRDCRVHAIAARYMPAHSLFDVLANIRDAEPESAVLSKALSSYVSGRDIGDEYRYILERRYARKFPGTMLARPGLLLNPWATRKTSMDRARAAEGGAYAASPRPAPRAPAQPASRLREEAEAAGDFPNLNFLAGPARVFGNLRPGPDGVVRIPRAGLENMSLLRVVAVDVASFATIYREVALPEPDDAHRDLRLLLGLDHQGHFTEKKQSTVLDDGEKLTVEDITTSTVERYDTLASVHRLLTTLVGATEATKLQDLSFAVEWTKLSEEQKRSKYSEFACHELSFFLSRKDRAFFTAVIQPYLRHKKDKTFMDHYLLEDDLARYLEPWAYGQLNVVERILLADRITGERGPTGRHVKERADLLPLDLEYDDRLFDSAIKGRSFEGGGGGLGFEEAKSEATVKQVQAKGYFTGGPAGMAPARSIAAPEKERRSRREKKKMAKDDAPPPPAAEMADLAEPMMDELADLDEEMAVGGGGGDAVDRLERDVSRRGEIRQLYRKIDKTEEWAENNYYKRRIGEQGPELVTANAFWRDYALRDPARPFVTAHFLKAASNFTEIMCALTVLDLPFEAGAHRVDYSGGRMVLTAGSRSVVLHQEIKPANSAEGAAKTPILISQNYFRQDDRYYYDGNEHHDKFVTGEMLVNVVYLTQVVLTNVSSSRQKLQLLLQIPRGALPVSNGFYTKSRHVQLEPYATQSIEVAYYFPVPGQYPHFPAHAAKNEELIAAAAPTVLNVVEKLSKIDETSWAWISQNADSAGVLQYLRDNNIDRLDLDKIAWRMKDHSFFEDVLRLLTERHVYHHVLWSYALHHRDLQRAAEYLRHQDALLRGTGLALDSPWLVIDPVARRWYEHLEYAPLVNARAHRLGGKTRILNDAFAQQYRQFLEVLTYRDKPRPADLLAATYYLLLQDRVADALETHARAGNIGGLQGDYLRAYVAFHRGDVAAAREAAEPHRDHPVDRWRKLFRNVLAQLEELKGGAVEVGDDDDRSQRHARLASTQAGFELAVERKTVTVNYQNLRAFTVNYYLMDIELLFSRQPFVQQQSDRFAIIRPNATQVIAAEGGHSSVSFELPAEYHSANVIVEVVADGIRKAQANYAHELGVQIIDQYGEVRVSRRGSKDAVPKAYVKAYARMQGGAVEFYKDGYTDLRGAFDYATVSTDELDRVERFALLIMTENLGAVIRECAPPKR